MALSQSAVFKEANTERLRAAREGPRKPPRVLVLVGLPGSGKSTFASHLRNFGWDVISQDALGSRGKCEIAMVEALVESRNIVIDRCNFDKRQRRHWVHYAAERGSKVGVVVFCTHMEECLDRVNARADHPTLEGGLHAEGVIERMAEDFVFPVREEGFEFCRVVRNQADFLRVLEQIHEQS